MGPIQNLRELFSWLRRRWRIIAVALVLGALGGVLLALRSERVYTATAVIQVINPVIAVGDATARGQTPDVTRRVQIIEQRLMARESLLDLAARFHLFDGSAISPAEQVALMRQSFSITAVAAAQQGFSRDGSLSLLSVSASNANPETAAAIANDLADSLVRMSASDRQSNAQQALAFYRSEEARLQGAIAALERNISDYRTANREALPEAIVQRRDEHTRLAENLLQIQQDLSTRRSELATLDPNSQRLLTQRRVAQLTDEISGLAHQGTVLNTRLAEIQAILQAAPAVEQTLLAMNRQMEQLQTQLTQAAAQRREAELAARVETDQQSERFALLERALVPEYPVSTSRKKLAAMGVAGGLMLGVFLAYALEWRAPVMRTAARMERDLQLRPVISIPYAMPVAERRRRWMIWILGLGVLIAGGIALGFALGVF